MTGNSGMCSSTSSNQLTLLCHFRSVKKSWCRITRGLLKNQSLNNESSFSYVILFSDINSLARFKILNGGSVKRDENASVKYEYKPGNKFSVTSRYSELAILVYYFSTANRTHGNSMYHHPFKDVEIDCLMMCWGGYCS